jgi:hypothetical protein
LFTSTSTHPYRLAISAAAFSTLDAFATSSAKGSTVPTLASFFAALFAFTAFAL